MRKKIKVGVVGLGNFGNDFMALFVGHPDIEEVVLCDRIEERIAATKAAHGLTRSYTDYDEMLKQKDIDCVAIFTQRHLHAPMVLKALEAGKHVYSAVPIACSIEEIRQIIEKVKETRLVYMMGETCYYFPCAIYCREKYKLGHFGKFVYGESQYYHDISHMAPDFQRTGGDRWQRVAGIPPMFYPTHSIAMLFTSINEYATKVSCMGYRDNNADNIYGEGKNNWDNPFSNETAIFQMSGGGVARINEFRRVGTNQPSSYITCMYGEDGAYERSLTQHTFQRRAMDGEEAYVEYLDDMMNPVIYLDDKKHWNPYRVEKVEDLYTLKHFEKTTGGIPWYRAPISPRYTTREAPIQDLSRLPKYFRAFHWGHQYSHPFLIDDFVRAVVDEKLPPNNAWDAARCMIPGLIAHESALRGGELLEIPDFGDAPADWARLTFEHKDYYEEGPENTKKPF